MSKKVISMGLNTKDINRAIKEIEQYKLELRKNLEECRKRIAEAIANEAQSNFNSADMDNVIGTVVDKQFVVGGSTHRPDVTVSVDEQGTMTVIVADGEDAVWCEFGAGVYHNGSVGSSPNPYGADLGLTIGSYGKGHGQQQSWGYLNENGEIAITRGTLATMPMYRAVQSVTKQAIEIAREVFGT